MAKKAEERKVIALTMFVVGEILLVSRAPKSGCSYTTHSQRCEALIKLSPDA